MRTKFRLTTKALCMLAILTAIKIILERLVSVSIGSYVRISFSFIPVAVSGMLLGPIGSTLVATVADVLGELLVGGVPFPGLTAVAALTGFLYGIFLHHQELTWKRAACCMLTISVVCSIVLNSLVLYWMGYLPHAHDALMASMATRIIRSVVQYPINVAILVGIGKLMKRIPSSMYQLC